MSDVPESTLQAVANETLRIAYDRLKARYNLLGESSSVDFRYGMLEGLEVLADLRNETLEGK